MCVDERAVAALVLVDSQAEEAVVQAWADYAALAIDHARLTERVRHLEEELAQLPGVAVELEPVREYTTGPLTAALLGVMTKVPEDNPNTPENETEFYIAQGYDPATDRVGASGLEAMLEDVLRGVKGHKIVEEDVLGHELRTVGLSHPPTPGDSVILTLDLDLQRIAEDALRRGMEKVGQKL
ncbi:MAG: hypothetical protein C4309_01780, partial [Chloroflexota bacterium]